MSRARNSKQGKPYMDQGSAYSPTGTSKRLQRSQNESRPSPTLKVLSWVSNDSTVEQLMEFHMTIRLQVDEFSPKQASMLLAIATVRAIANGVDLTLYLSMEWLTSFLKKSGVDVLYEKNEKVRQTLLLAELVLTSVKGNWFQLDSYEKLPNEVLQEIIATGWLPNRRTLESWSQHWKLERYLAVRIVPVEQFLSRQPSAAERYSGYIRGYGQDGNPPAPHKTKDEPVDGVATPDPPSFTLQELEHYNNILNQIEIQKSRKRR